MAQTWLFLQNDDGPQALDFSVRQVL